MKIAGREAAAYAAALLGCSALIGCGGGGGSAPKNPQQANLYMLKFSLPNYSGVFLDEDVAFELSAPVKVDSINPDSVQIRTGASGGIAPLGTFVRGRFLVDVDSGGNRVVIDRDQVTELTVRRAERSGNVVGLEDVRIDLGANSPSGFNGTRLPLFNRGLRDVVTFVPEIPTRAILDDTGYQSASTYTVVVPAFPSTNTLENLDGDPLFAPDNRVFASTFTTVPATAPALFLGSEASGPPRVINTSPFNGATGVDVLERILIRFSQPLDPRTVIASEFRVDAILSNGSQVGIPVSTFLAQERLGKVQVTLTPLGPLPQDLTIRVSVGAGIEDTTGRALTASTFSFFTGSGVAPFSGPYQEEFDDAAEMDGVLTTANWANTKPYVGGVDGALTAAFAPYAGNGADGPFSATTGVTTDLDTGTSQQRIYNFTTFDVPIGATVRAVGNYPLVIQCQGAVTIDGTIEANGSAGGVGFSGTGAAPTIGNGGAGGLPGPGGAAGGNGAFFTVGGAGNFDGQDGFGFGAGLGGFSGENDAGYTAFWPRTTASGSPQTCSATNATQPSTFHQCRIREGGGGGGFAASGNNAEQAGTTGMGRNGSLLPNGGNGGAAWGSVTFANASSNASVEVSLPGGGTTVIVLNGIPTLVQLQGGSGGGGGGGEDDRDGASQSGTAGNEDEGGGGGGGGGGAIQIRSYTNITVNGAISCNGGEGGDSAFDALQTDFGQGAGGGGGSGGAVWLQCRGTMTLGLGVAITVEGGAGGSGYGDGTSLVRLGGNGAQGRMRLEDGDGSIFNSPAGSSLGTFSPTLDLSSTAVSNWQDTGIFTPKFPAFVAFDDALLDNNCDDNGNGTPFETGESCDPTIDLEILPTPADGEIRVYLEGAPENFSTPGVDDPDEINSTGFVKIFDSTTGGYVAGATDLIENMKYWRFRVDFVVNAGHAFNDPMPIVRMIRVGVTQQ